MAIDVNYAGAKKGWESVPMPPSEEAGTGAAAGGEGTRLCGNRLQGIGAMSRPLPLQ
jgi:hypothetical protein